MRPFATGATVLGHVMYFLGLLILSSRWHTSPKSSPVLYGASRYHMLNAAMLASIALCVLLGSIFAIPAATNVALVFLVLWAMEKELEVQWGAAGIAVLFANFVALYFAAHHLHTHPRLVTSIFEPEGVYYT